MLHHVVRRRLRPTQGSGADGDDDNIVTLFVNYVFALRLFVCKCNVLPVPISVPFYEGISTGGTAAPHSLNLAKDEGENLLPRRCTHRGEPQCQINRELHGPQCRSGLSKHRESVRPAGNQTFPWSSSP